jgi:hypothetical protein
MVLIAEHDTPERNMALTQAKKEANRQARSERDRAWRARYKERAAAETGGLARIEQQFESTITAASVRVDEAECSRSGAIATRRQEIERLELELKAFTKASMDELHEVRKPLHAAYDAKRAAEAALQIDLDRQFPDLAGSARWSAAVWSAAKESNSSPRSSTG